MAETEKIENPTTVTFNIEEQELHQTLGTSLTFSRYVHTALAEKLDKDRMAKQLYAQRRD